MQRTSMEGIPLVEKMAEKVQEMQLHAWENICTICESRVEWRPPILPMLCVVEKEEYMEMH